MFIIDEVHMLSKGAFNALLKTLEEPPAHVKFIFATTEIRKVPVTVLSRCQRFDLRRVDVPVLSRTFRSASSPAEGASADDDALALIARAAEGSVRDGLSILDQAIAMGSGAVTSPTACARCSASPTAAASSTCSSDVRRRRTRGRAGRARRPASGDGAEPVQVLADLADAVHITTRDQGRRRRRRRRSAVAGGTRARGRRSPTTLSLALLARAWQMLLKGIEEAGRAPIAARRRRDGADPHLPHRRPADAGRDHPHPRWRGAGATWRARFGRHVRRAAAPAAQCRARGSDDASASGSRSRSRTASFLDVVELVGERRDAKLKLHLEDHVSLLKFEPGHIEVSLLDGAPTGLAGELGEKLTKWTGRRWVVSVGRGRGEPPLGDVRRAAEAERLEGAKADPAVAAVLSAFPEAEVRSVRPLKSGSQRGE